MLSDTSLTTIREVLGNEMVALEDSLKKAKEPDLFNALLEEWFLLRLAFHELESK